MNIQQILLYFGIPVAIAIIWLIQQLISKDLCQRRLEKENSEILQEISQLINEKTEYQKQLSVLRQQLFENSIKENISFKYGFDKRNNILRHKHTGDPYCNKCFATSNVESRLITEATGWRCDICGECYGDPDRNHRITEYRDL